MQPIDFIILGLYMAGVLTVGFYFFKKNENTEDYYVGGRSMSPTHVGLSVVATDVGGGFSIGLGGLGYIMGISGSWMLFTGLVGAWMSAVLIIPKIKALDKKFSMMTYPDFLRQRYGPRVALVAALISGIGYLGFTAGQILAGATLFSESILTTAPFGMEPLLFSICTIAVVIVLYTVLGGIKAVIYTDTIQWSILLLGLVFLGIPFAIHHIGGWSQLTRQLPDSYFSITNLSWTTFINWMITILPIWFIGMTLYQRMYACRNEKEAKRAWYIAGLFEYPVMAFTGVFLGLCSRVIFPYLPSEAGLPNLIKTVLPIGVTGIVVASYFSAIMSTADSCLMAASGNFVSDVILKLYKKSITARQEMRLSQFVTLVIGIIAVVLASNFDTVIDAILCAYAFMVAGLFVPTLGAYFWRRSSSIAAFWSMVSGGTLTFVLISISGSSLLGVDDFKAPERLANKLADKNNAVSVYLQNYLDKEVINKLEKEHQNMQQFASDMANNLNNALKSSCMYEENRFASVKLSAATRKLLQKKLQGKELILLNRQLLEDAYPKTIKPRRPLRLPGNLDPSFFGILLSALVFFILSWIFPARDIDSITVNAP